jgi:glycogen synthase
VRILQLAQFYNPIIGGEEAHVGTLSRSLAGRGHQVSLITYATADDAGVTTESGVEIIRVRPLSSSIPFIYTDRSWPHAMPISDPVVARTIARYVRANRPDIAHSHNWITNSALRPLHKLGVPLVTTLHDYSQTCATKRYRELGVGECTGPAVTKCLRCSMDKFGRLSGAATLAGNAWMSRRRCVRTMQFLSVSNAVAQRVSIESTNSFAASGVRSTVIPNFIPDEMIVESILPPGQDAPIVFVGDLTRDKGVDVLVDAYSKLAKPPEMILIGRITVETPNSVPPGIRVIGPLAHSKAMEYVERACMLVVPSTWQDPCPTVVLEGMALGRPVVASAAGGITDMVVHDETGLLVPPADAAALAGAITLLLEAPQRGAAMGAAGRDRARAFRVSSVVDRLETVYSDCVEDSRRERLTSTLA